MKTHEEIKQFLFYLKYYVKSLSIVDITFSLCHRKLNMLNPVYINQCNFNMDKILIINDWSFLDLNQEINKVADAKGLVILYKQILKKTLDIINKTRIVVCIYLAYKMIKLFNQPSVELALTMGRTLQKFCESSNFLINILIQ
ncbi:apoptosis regulation Bcl-2 family protein [Lymphocystis disease virus 4]|uniref:Apoptosis regulation Bcl-2 family protein n=1 Tax=Lymphocystis disease virus 4 TaxID=2704413 RepID=A0A6B9XHM8_9VIRU|nr:apoptosis regulation Bcl-2 family protein [Lymphocystis disease virus 4]QHR78536.1 apoptosis regulation Bcl-2 family protein [Lymphocystis disease virus 4]